MCRGIDYLKHREITESNSSNSFKVIDSYAVIDRQIIILLSEVVYAIKYQFLKFCITIICIYRFQ